MINDKFRNNPIHFIDKDRNNDEKKPYWPYFVWVFLVSQHLQLIYRWLAVPQMESKPMDFLMNLRLVRMADLWLLQTTATNLIPGDNNDFQDVFVHDRQTGQTELISVTVTGRTGNGPSGEPIISADGRFVVFSSDVNNLVANDSNNQYDVFIRDRENGTTELVSVSSTGVQGNFFSDVPAMTPDARFIAFRSAATNLGPTDTNFLDDIYLRDRELGTTELISVSTSGVQGNDISLGASISAGRTLCRVLFRRE